MRADQRVLVNTIALYTKIVINIVVQLYLARLVLNALGVNDYGIYNLIAGTIAFLAFLNSALATSTQRYFNVLQGKKDYEGLKKYFSSSLIIHALLSLIFILIFEVAYFFVFDGFFNIAADRMYEAKVVYQLTAISTIVTVIGVPYTSAINANEDLVYFAVVESICAILKLGLIRLFKIPDINTLIVYSAWISFITILGVVLKWYWCQKKYPECRHLHFQWIKSIIRDMLSFSGWNALTSFSLMCSSQGIAFVINIFWGTAINAVYGIANQVNGQLSYFSQMLTASFAPQIVKSVGEENYDKLRFLSVFSSKVSFFMSAVFAIPLILNLDYILCIWLKNVPSFTSEFCSLVIYVFLVQQLYPGVNRAIIAVGKIRDYQIALSVILIIPILGGILLYKTGHSSYSICYVMILGQTLSLITSSLYAYKYFDLDLKKYYSFVVKATSGYALTYILFVLIKQLYTYNLNPFFTFLFISITSMALFSSYYWIVVFNHNEKNRLINLLPKRKK